MQELYTLLPQEFYKRYLKRIGNIKFSQREIDTIACIVSGKSAKKISSLLSISPKTVITHKHNIMQKLDCNSQESIRDFIETSQKSNLLRTYYSSLLNYEAFKRSLAELRALISHEPLSVLIVFLGESDSEWPYVSNLKDHLTLAGFSVTLERKETTRLLNVSTNSSSQANHIIYCLPDRLLKDVQLNNTFKDITQDGGTQHAFFLFSTEEDGAVPEDLSSLANIYHVANQNYYFVIFEIFKQFLPHHNFDEIINSFKENLRLSFDQNKNYDSPAAATPKKTIKNDEDIHPSPGGLVKSKKEYLTTRQFAGFVVVVCMLVLLIVLIKNDHLYKKDVDLKSNTHIRSDLTYPNDSILLPRPKLLKEIDNKLNHPKDIQTIALVGPAGAGKTTLARQYAHQQDANIVWEINAETFETAFLSLEKLATYLAKTPTDQKTLRAIQEIKDILKKEEKLLQLVKTNLKNTSDWLLLYDNVERFTDIKRLFPSDSKTWGRGKIILTTKDKNIANNKCVDQNLNVEELTADEKLALFNKILTSSTQNKVNSTLANEKIAFLKSIPPFPLDVSVAAYYINSTQIPYKDYLERMSTHNREFTETQKSILKETGDYSKTRYEIIAQSVENLASINDNFLGLLLFISLLDSQQIPRDLLNRYKAREIVDNFVYHLRKYSLITERDNKHALESNFSIHRSTQAIILAYLAEKLHLSEDKTILIPILTVVQNYLKEGIEEEDLDKLKEFTAHGEVLISYRNLLPATFRSIIGAELGYIYNELGDYFKGKQVVENYLSELNKNSEQGAEALTYLGLMYRERAYYNQAKDNLEQALTIYKKSKSPTYGPITIILTYLGDIYRVLGDLQKAKTSLLASLENYRKIPEEKTKYLIRIHSYLARVYRDLGDYGLSLKAFQQSLILNNNEESTLTASTFGHLGDMYRELGEFEKAKEALKKCYYIYHKLYPEYHIHTAWASAHLGNLLRYLGEYKQAIELVEKSLRINIKVSSGTRIGEAWSTTLLGNIYRSIGEYKTARNLLEKSLTIYTQRSQDPHKIAWASACLGTCYRSLGEYEKAQQLFERSLAIYKRSNKESNAPIAWVTCLLGIVNYNMGRYDQAKNLLEESLSHQKKIFPEGYIGIAWTSAHLANIYRHFEEFEKAQALLEHSLLIYQKQLPANHISIAWVLALLGNTYKEQNKLEKAIQLLQKSLHMHSNILGDKNIRTRTVAFHLGDVYRKGKKLDKAKALLNVALPIFESNYGRNHIETARVIQSIGLVYLEEGDIESAEKHLHEAHNIFKNSHHPDISKVLENLANLSLRKSHKEKNVEKEKN